jgi:hypothetical protein
MCSHRVQLCALILRPGLFTLSKPFSTLLTSIMWLITIYLHLMQQTTSLNISISAPPPLI